MWERKTLVCDSFFSAILFPLYRLDQCNQHWFRVLLAAVVSNPWTEEENQKLLRFSRDFPKCNWKTVAAEIGNGRTEVQCKFQFKKLEHEEQSEHVSKKRKQIIETESEEEEEEEEEPEKPIVPKKSKKVTDSISPPITITPKAIFEDDEDFITSTADLNLSVSTDVDSIATYDAFDHESMISVLSPRFSPTLTDDFLTPLYYDEDEFNVRLPDSLPPFGDL